MRSMTLGSGPTRGPHGDKASAVISLMEPCTHTQQRPMDISPLLFVHVVFCVSNPLQFVITRDRLSLVVLFRLARV